MKDAPDRLQRAMNHCLAQIGIEHAEHRTCAIDIEDLCVRIHPDHDPTDHLLHAFPLASRTIMTASRGTASSSSTDLS